MGRISGITVEIGGDTTKLQTALHLPVPFAYTVEEKETVGTIRGTQYHYVGKEAK